MTPSHLPRCVGGLAAWTESWFVSEVHDLGTAIALRCPEDPEFRWGNLLVLGEPPHADALPALEARFDDAFSDLPGVTHRTFAWSEHDGALEAFIAAGYEPDRNVVRVGSAGDLTPAPPAPAGFAMHVASTEEDWATLRAIDLADVPGEDPDAYARHRDARWMRYRAIARGDEPQLSGGYIIITLHGTPVASVGVYVRNGVGRFQYVHVLPAYRNAGVATSMVHGAARMGFTHWGATRLVIIADEGDPPDRIYARLGLSVAERYVGACLRSSGTGQDGTG